MTKVLRALYDCTRIMYPEMAVGYGGLVKKPVAVDYLDSRFGIIGGRRVQWIEVNAFTGAVGVRTDIW